MNPFIFGSIVTGKNFTNRTKILKSLKDTCRNGQNILIYGDRRIGKTSLIVELLKHNFKNIPKVRIDLMGVTSIQDFCERYLNGLQKLENQSFFQRIGKLLKSLRPQISFNADGTPELNITVDSKNNKKSLIEVLELPEKIISKNKNAVIVFDEFQDILKINELKNIQAIIRGIIQYHENISYIFLGSKKHILLDMFENKTNPFYNSAKIIPLGKIEKKYFVPYLEKKFISGKRKISEDIINKICEAADNIPNEIQRLSHAIWEATETNSIITTKELNKGIELVCHYQRDLFEEIYKNVSMYQSRILNALAIQPIEKISSKNLIQKYNLSSSATVYKALNTLIDNEIVCNENGVYKIAIPFFSKWIINLKS